MTPADPSPDRRTVLRAGVVGTAAVFQALLARSAGARQGRIQHGPYGPLAPVRDERTGLPLLRLPRGFRYVTIGWRGDPLTDGSPTPARHDGMGAVSIDDQGVVTLVRNHERFGVGTPFGPSSITYDPVAIGGTTRLRFDVYAGELVSSDVGIAGTNNNCAGGITPQGTWLTCEETISGPGQGFQVGHGWIFEVPGSGTADPEPLRDMGRFVHEAVAVDPATGYVYETEDDRYTSGFYRFRPRDPRRLAYVQGGALEMLKVVGVENADMMLVSTGESFPVEWVPIANPRLGIQNGVGPFGSTDGQTSQASGPFFQGYQLGGAQFRRLEGCWYDPVDRVVYFTDTEGGFARQGVVWRYDPATELASVVYASPGAGVLDNPDNLTVGPRGGLLLCEDGGQGRQRMHVLTPEGEIHVFAQNDVVLNGEVNGITGNYRSREWCGATFDPTGRWLFCNIQTPGITFAITGPWHRGPL